MKAGKREDRLYLIIQVVSLLSRYNTMFFEYRDIPCGFFPGAGWAKAKRNNIKEDIK